MLTTVDNPYDPFEQFDDWYRFDNDNGYCSCAYLARIAKVSDALNEVEYQEEIERAIDEIIANDIFNVYKKFKVEEEETDETNQLN